MHASLCVLLVPLQAKRLSLTRYFPPQTFGDARLVTASFDAARDKDGYIVPGIGDFEDRYMGQAVTVVDLPEEAESESGEGDLTKKLTSWWPFGSKD